MLFDIKNMQSGKVLTIEYIYETIMFRASRHILAARFLPDGTLTYVNEMCRKYLPGRPGDTILKDMHDKEQRKKIAKRIYLFTKEEPIRTYIDNIHGMKIRWYNRAIYNDDESKKEFEGIGWVIKEKEEKAVSEMII
jgi:hypothetical protein